MGTINKSSVVLKFCGKEKKDLNMIKVQQHQHQILLTIVFKEKEKEKEKNMNCVRYSRPADNINEYHQMRQFLIMILVFLRRKW